MILKNISEAKSQLSALIAAVQKGEEILIGKAGKPVARLIAYHGVAQPRTPGILAGKIVIHDDFDAPLPSDLADAFGTNSPKPRKSKK